MNARKLPMFCWQLMKFELFTFSIIFVVPLDAPKMQECIKTRTLFLFLFLTPCSNYESYFFTYFSKYTFFFKII